MAEVICSAAEKARILEQAKEKNAVESRMMTREEQERFGVKQCRLCGRFKPVEMFSPDKRTPDGLKTDCKKCRAAAERKRKLPKDLGFTEEIAGLKKESAELKQLLEGAKSTVQELRNGMRIHDSGNRTRFASGAVRDMHAGKGRCDLLPARALLRLARHFEAGATKYGDRNWEQGIPISSFLDSGIRHLLKYVAGVTNEDHLCAAAWNIMCAMDTEERRPEMQDIPARHEVG